VGTGARGGGSVHGGLEAEPGRWMLDSFGESRRKQLWRLKALEGSRGK
jgi:hypothetical protein